MAPMRPGPHGSGGTSRARIERLIFVFLFVVVVVSSRPRPRAPRSFGHTRRKKKNERKGGIFYLYFF